MRKNEFEKADAAKQPCQWKQTQIILVACLGMVSSVMAIIALFHPELNSAQRMSMLIAVAVMNSLAGAGWWGHGFFPAIPNQRVRDAICISGSMLMALWAVVFCHLVLPQADFTVSQLMVAILWAMTAPVGVLLGLIVGLEKSALKKVAAFDSSAGRR
jgi:hypothetical protein